MYDRQNIVRVQKEGLIDQFYNLYVGVKTFREGGVSISVPKPLEFEELPESMDVAPLLQMSITDCQVLIDSLWDAGLRPSEGTGSAGSLAATQGHLNDMRKIVFKHLKIK